MNRKLSEKTRKRMSAAHMGVKRERHSETTRRKMCVAHLGSHHSLETRLKISKANKGKNTWSKGKHLSKEHRKKIGCATALRNIGNVHSVETKRKIGLASKGRVLSEKTKGKISIGNIGKNAGKKQSREHIMKRLAKIQVSPNNFEQRCFQYLERIYPGRFKYVGDGSILVCNRSCDFIDMENKIVVLCNGVYWHLGQFDLATTDKNKRLKEKIEMIPFIEADYRVIFLWEDEIT